MSKYKERIVDVEVVEFSKNGHGIAYLEGENHPLWTIEVPFTIPGDKARVKLLGKKSGVFASLLEEILLPSKNRIQPRCIHFGSCGGCRWQQQPYALQLQHKENFVREKLQSFINSKTIFHPILGCEPPWYYRNKMEFSFSANAAKDRFLGMVMNASRGKVFNLTECHLVNQWFVDALKSVKKWWDESGLEAYHPSKDAGSLRTLTVREGRRTNDRMVILTVSGNANFALNKAQLDSFVHVLRESSEPSEPNSKLSIFLRIHQIAKGHPTNFYEILLYGPESIKEVLHIRPNQNEPPVPLTFNISPTAFFQPNTQQAEKLYSLSLQKISINSESVVYDLYCGTGTLGICAAKKAKQVIGIELSPEAVLDAKSNILENKLNNVTILQGDVGKVLSQIREEKKFPLADIVLVDPPRVGLGAEAIKQILDLKAPTILYISCNPKTQADDVFLLNEGGYKVSEIQPVDQFSQTIHIENIVVLKKE